MSSLGVENVVDDILDAAMSRLRTAQDKQKRLYEAGGSDVQAG